MPRRQAPKTESGPAGKAPGEPKGAAKGALKKELGEEPQREEAAVAEPKPRTEPRAVEKPPRPSPETQKARKKEPVAGPSPGRLQPAAPSPSAPSTAEPSAAAGPGPAAPEAPPSLSPEASRSTDAVVALVSEVEKWVSRGMERLENKLLEVSKSIRDLLARGAPEPSPPKAKPSKAPPAPEVDDLTASVRRAMSEAIDRRLEEAIAPTVSLYNRLREEEQALAKEPSSFSVKETRAILSEAATELEKILRLLGGDFIRPKAGEFYDPIIHLAVGEATSKSPGNAGSGATVVAELVSPGYKSARGKVICPAKVIVEKR